MGRAIDMEKQIDSLTMKVERLENITRGMASDLNTLMSKSSSVKNIDIHEDTKEKKNVKKKADNKASSNSTKSSNGKSSASAKSSSGDGDSSK